MRDQILAALRTEWPLPVSTRKVCELLGAHRYDETGYRVYPQLCALDRLGIVERIRRDPECRDVFWRFLGDPTDAELNAAVDAITPQAAESAASTESADERDTGTDMILSTLDSYINALDKAEKRFAATAASGDHEEKAEAVDNLAALVRQFVDVCNNWPAAASHTNRRPS